MSNLLKQLTWPRQDCCTPSISQESQQQQQQRRLQRLHMAVGAGLQEDVSLDADTLCGDFTMSDFRPSKQMQDHHLK